MKFGDQNLKNVHDIRKMIFKISWCVYVSLFKCYVFVLDENHVGHPILVYVHVWVGNDWIRLYVGSTKVPRGGPQLGAQHCQAVPNNGQSPRRRPVNWSYRWSLSV